MTDKKPEFGLNALMVHGYPMITMSQYLLHKDEFHLDDREIIIANDLVWFAIEKKITNEKKD